MTEAPATAQQPEPAEFLQAWSKSFSQVLGQISGAAFPCVVEKETPADLVPAAEGDLWIMITASGSLRGEMSLRLLPASVLRLGQIFMSEPPAPEAELTGDHREAAVELLRQVSGIVSTEGKERWGEFQILVEAASAAPSWPAAATIWLRAGEPTQPAGTIVLEFGLSAALIAQLRSEKNDASPSQPAEATTVSNPPAAPAVAEQNPGTLNLLMDVQLEMTLRFGAKKLLLRDVLDLNPGAVVELDRKVQEPVELLLDGKLIGRGEVVVIGGSYGLRITEVGSFGNA
jgi:flagellar motor switch protein FliN